MYQQGNDHALSVSPLVFSHSRRKQWDFLHLPHMQWDLHPSFARDDALPGSELEDMEAIPSLTDTNQEYTFVPPHRNNICHLIIPETHAQTTNHANQHMNG